MNISHAWLAIRNSATLSATLRCPPSALISDERFAGLPAEELSHYPQLIVLLI